MNYRILNRCIKINLCIKVIRLEYFRLNVRKLVFLVIFFKEVNIIKYIGLIRIKKE